MTNFNDIFSNVVPATAPTITKIAQPEGFWFYGQCGLVNSVSTMNYIRRNQLVACVPVVDEYERVIAHRVFTSIEGVNFRLTPEEYETLVGQL